MEATGQKSRTAYKYFPRGWTVRGSLESALNRSVVILTGLIKVLTSDDESTTSRAFCLHARWRLGSRASRQDQEVTSPAPEETSFCLQTVYLEPTLRAFPQLRSGFQPTRRRNFGLNSDTKAGSEICDEHDERDSPARNNRRGCFGGEIHEKTKLS